MMRTAFSLSIFCLMLCACTPLTQVHRQSYPNGLEAHNFAVALPSDRADYYVDDTRRAFSAVAREEIEKILLAKGYPSSESQAADHVFGLSLASKADRELDPDKARYMHGVRGSLFPDADPRGRSYMRFEFALDLFKVDTSEKVWRVTSDIDDLNQLLGSEQNVRGLVQEMLADFPARQTS